MLADARKDPIRYPYWAPRTRPQCKPRLRAGKIVIYVYLANLNFLRYFSQLPLSNVSLFTVFITADVVFLLAFWSGICLQVDVDKITALPHPPRLDPMILVTVRKVSRIASCKALRWGKVITIGRVCIVQYRIIFSFHSAKRIHDPDSG